MSLLEIKGLSKMFGGLTAVDGVTLDAESSEILGLIGPNGAGKTTMVNLISGALKPNSGRIIFKDKDITRWPTYKRAGCGMARVFQRDVIFQSLTVIENLFVGFHLQSRAIVKNKFWAHNPRDNKEVLYDKAMSILQYVGLAHRSSDAAINLPHGNKRALCIAIALATQPQFLLLDEPLTGMNSEELDNMIKIIIGLKKYKGVGILLVEHNIRAVKELCDRVIVLNFGKKIAEGPPNEVVKNPEVIRAYLGDKTNVA